ncbi:hypothetical protein SDC9_146524 [bioreactor metagenome]|uniref:Uncharacterized protein n=1 Tax=bioreactor metagenome TaxID=1076179 RepID=A0A645EEY6_9ZZZZ
MLRIKDIQFCDGILAVLHSSGAVGMGAYGPAFPGMVTGDVVPVDIAQLGAAPDFFLQDRLDEQWLLHVFPPNIFICYCLIISVMV